ncbi:hypothetical protein [Spirulina major]|uniref:hypothetical protein n=1 Tax=Spirulina major TaxID=270636 RepID=UPI000932B85E|nr:hypothetical protein [Spirulina major]
MVVKPVAATQRTVTRSERRGQRHIIRITTLPPVATHARSEGVRQRSQNNPRWRLLLVWLIVSVLVSGGGGISGLWLTERFPDQDCQTPIPLRSQSKQLYCQQVMAVAGDLDVGLEILTEVSQWSPQHPLYADQAELLQVWSDWAMDRAEQRLAAGDLEGAIAIIQQIPDHSPRYGVAQTHIAQWRTAWREATEREQTFEGAIARQDWQGAMDQIYALSQSPLPYWRSQRTDQLLIQLRHHKATQIDQKNPN